MRRILMFRNKYLLVFLIIFFNSTSKSIAQSSLFDNKPIWSIQSICGGPWCFDQILNNIYVNGDTVFDSHKYKKLFMRGAGYQYWNGPLPIPAGCQSVYSFDDSLNPVGYIRDTLNRVYVNKITIPNLDSALNDTLLYDYNLAVGDTLPLTFNNVLSDITVVAIDSVLINGSYLLKFNLSANSMVPFFIEGVGHDFGFIEPLSLLGPGTCQFSLGCYGQQDTSYYPMFGSSCRITVGLDHTEVHSPIKVGPNPVIDRLTLSSDVMLDEVVIYNLHHKAVYQRSHINLTSLIIALDHLRAGLYLLKTIDINGRFETHKILKIE